MRLMQDQMESASNAFLFATCGPMIHQSPQHVIRELTVAEQVALDAARVAADAEKDEIREQARAAKSAWLETRHVVDSLVAHLKLERERQQLSLADIEDRTGIRRSVLSRLENDTTSNPTMLTLQRYAVSISTVAERTLAPTGRRTRDT